jgi:hypothetical protein
MSSPPPSGADRPGSGWNPDPWPGSANSRQGRVPQAAPLSDPLVPPDLRGWFERVIGVVRRSLVPLLIIQVGVAVISAMVSFAMSPALAAGPDPSGFDSLLALLGVMIAVAVGVFAQGASVYIAIRDAAGHQASAQEAMQFAAARAPALIGWGLVAGVLTVFGFLMLIVPGLYLAIVFGAALAGVVTVERAGIARCFELVNARFGPTVARMVLAVAVGISYTVVAGFVVGALSTPDSFSEALLRALVEIPLGMAAVGVAVVTYAELRFHERGEVFTSTLAAELVR